MPWPKAFSKSESKRMEMMESDKTSKPKAKSGKKARGFAALPGSKGK